MRLRERYTLWIVLAILMALMFVFIMRGDRVENPYNGLRLLSPGRVR